MRSACVLALFVAVSLTVVVGPAIAKPKPGGNSKAAHPCQHGGWKHLVRADGRSFKNAGQCVSYAAHGGTPKTLAQLVCESVGGVFAPGSGNTLWYCTYTAGAAFGPIVWRLAP